MIAHRYLLIAGIEIRRRPSLATEIEANTGLARCYHSTHAMLFVEPGSTSIALEPARGAILGALFSADGDGAAAAELAPGSMAAIWESRGDHLISHYWGNYLAVLDEPSDQRVDLIRAPCSGMPCYYVESEQYLIASSDVATMVRAGYLSRQISRDFLIDHLLRPTLRTERTAIVGLRELAAGARLTKHCGKPTSTERLWSPWDVAGPDRAVRGRDLARELVGAAVARSVKAWARLSGHILLGVSGGLDSSIVAACLARSGFSFDMMTQITKEAAGDERFFVHALANAFDAPLHEAFESLELVDLRHSDAAHLPRPLARSFAQSGGTLTARIADDVGAKTIWSGGGGDNVFCFLQSTVPVADRLLADGIGRSALGTASDMARLTGASVIRVLLKSIRRAYWRSPAYRWPVDRSFLSAECRQRSIEEPGHPWLDVPPGRMPGEAAHIALILAIENFLEGYHQEERLPRCFPLLSQPVVEACLRVPAWLWCEGGINRAVARGAFVDTLPTTIIDRTVKGTPSSFVMEILERNRAVVRDMLEQGQLAQLRLLDLPSIRAALVQPGPIQGVDYSRMLGLADIEAWLGAVGLARAGETPAIGTRLSEARSISQ